MIMKKIYTKKRSLWLILWWKLGHCVYETIWHFCHIVMDLIDTTHTTHKSDAPTFNFQPGRRRLIPHLTRVLWFIVQHRAADHKAALFTPGSDLEPALGFDRRLVLEPCDLGSFVRYLAGEFHFFFLCARDGFELFDKFTQWCCDGEGDNWILLLESWLYAKEDVKM